MCAKPVRSQAIRQMSFYLCVCVFLLFVECASIPPSSPPSILFCRCKHSASHFLKSSSFDSIAYLLCTIVHLRTIESYKQNCTYSTRCCCFYSFHFVSFRGIHGNALFVSRHRVYYAHIFSLFFLSLRLK